MAPREGDSAAERGHSQSPSQPQPGPQAPPSILEEEALVTAETRETCLPSGHVLWFRRTLAL